MTKWNKWKGQKTRSDPSDFGWCSGSRERLLRVAALCVLLDLDDGLGVVRAIENYYAAE
jgi:hypothetical protein